MIRVDCEQGSYEWKLARCGIPTASRFDQIITPKTRRPSASAVKVRDELLVEWLFGEPQEGGASQFMDRGKEFEAEAVAWYEWNYDVRVDRVGFCLTDDRSAGCSPDGLVGDEGGLEIKVLGAKGHVGAMLRGYGDEYWCQIQGGMYVTGRAWWDRLLYHPTLPSIVTRFERDEEFMEKLGAALAQFTLDLEDDKQRLLEAGCKPVPPRNEDAYCRHVRDDGRRCMSRAGVVRVGDEWRCEEHGPSLGQYVDAAAEVFSA